MGRVLVDIMRELAAARGLELRAFSGDWILRLEGGGRAVCVFGYDFPHNDATARLAAKDKSAAADLMRHGGVPCVEHVLFLHPSLAGHVAPRGNIVRMLDAAARWNNDAVVKPNEGTGGRGVYRCRDGRQLEDAALRLFATERAICLSPFLSIDRECRLIVLDGEVLLAYEKIRPIVMGDGLSAVWELAGRAAMSGWREGDGWWPGPGGGDAWPADGGDPFFGQVAGLVPAKGEEVLLNWRHNLGQGGRPRVMDAGEADLPPLLELARDAMRALGLRFASVDIIEAEGGWKVLEVNAGIMMEAFARHSPDGYALAKRVYARALDAI